MESDAHVVKNIIYPGQKYIPIKHGYKVHFHFQTWKLGKESVLIDDSREIGNKKPMILVVGRNFKFEVWENIVKMMLVGEVSSFKVKKEVLNSYPILSKTLRELGQERHRKKHTCTCMHSEGIGYPDLDDLIKNPTDLEFIIEMLKVDPPKEHEEELWQMNIDDPLKLVPALKEIGNKFYTQKLFDQAEDAYTEAISICEQLMNRERKTDDEWIILHSFKLSILLNVALCKLIKGDYYAVIEHCNTVLEHDPENVKALYRRGRGHIGAWNPDLAEQDFKQLRSMSPILIFTADKQLDIIRKLRQEKEEEDRNSLKKMFATENKTQI